MSQQKPIKRIEYVERIYWDCGHGHRHQTEEIASRCIEGVNNRQPKPNLTARNRAIILSILDGATVTDTTGKFSLSPTRVTGIFQREIRRLRKYASQHIPTDAPEYDEKALLANSVEEIYKNREGLRVLLTTFWTSG
jgi:hypothetical protein